MTLSNFTDLVQDSDLQDELLILVFGLEPAWVRIFSAALKNILDEEFDFYCHEAGSVMRTANEKGVVIYAR